MKEPQLLATPQPLAAFRLLRSQRRKRVAALTKQAVRVVIDPVIALYLLGFLVLMVAMMREQIVPLLNLPHFADLNIHLVNLAFLCLFVVAGFTDVLKSPRYAFTYSDFLLYFLPTEQDRYLRRVMLWQQLQRLGIFAALLLLAYVIQTFYLQVHLLSAAGYTLLLLTFALTDTARGLLQWIGYQQTLWLRIVYVIASLVLGIGGLSLTFFWLLSRGTANIWMFYVPLYLVFVALTAWLWLRPLSAGTDWHRTIQYGENKTWNGFWVRLVMGPEPFQINRPWIQAKVKPKPQNIPYKLLPLYTLQWRKYLWQNKRSVLVNMAMYMYVAYIGVYRSDFPWGEIVGFLVASLLAVFVTREIIGERLGHASLAVLPWSVPDLTLAFLRSVWWLCLLLAIPQGLLLWQQEYSWVQIPAILFGQIALFLVYYEQAVNARIEGLLGNKRNPVEAILALIGYVGLLFLATRYPLLAPLAVLLNLFVRRSRHGQRIRKSSHA